MYVLKLLKYVLTGSLDSIYILNILFCKGMYYLHTIYRKK